jgi:carotenoid cleavage dioxygenase-like enzyme
MACINRYAEQRSDLAILDAQHLDGPPLALVKSPIRVRSTFYAVWVP